MSALQTFFAAGWIGIGIRLLLIALCAWLLHRLMRGVIGHLGGRSIIPAELLVGLRRTSSFLITAGAVLLALQQLGVSTTVVWTALTGFIAVGAIAFFAAWSVLSNIFCTVLIITTRLFRLHDRIEILENGEKRGLQGEVVDLNIIYTTLREVAPDGTVASVLQVPNSLFFQRVIRRWTGPVPPQPMSADHQSPDT
ncbi:MAG TPA: mechanosensitive ion channel [Povalibacter sp.]|uniref:mechanosensitive ion channel family protein n=1 Tax=Povalibacter sp. TaxID=1962978 RepID=UPI002C2F334C|nr:mechanosensitive ion channel domain-containing protein [Povalibacter sp.]HMN44256.1 mechanosensitive ion channel [Povalibacter sp.]